MEDLVKTLVTAPTSGVLVVAGLAFLAVAVFGRLSDRLDPGPNGRLAAGALGAVLLVVGLRLAGPDNRAEPAGASSPPSLPSSSPASGQATTASGSASQPSSPGSVAAPAPSAGAYPIALAAGQVVKREDRTYTILKMQLDENDAKEFALDITTRMLNDHQYPGNFWNDNFRLVVDGVPRAPVGTLDEVVAAHAAKEGVVKFVVPRDAKSVILQIDRFGPDAPGVTIELPSH